MIRIDDEYNEILELRQIFIQEIQQLIEETEDILVDLLHNPDQPARLKEVFRYLHTMKGSSASVGIEDISHLVHKAEDFLHALQGRQQAMSPEETTLLLYVIDAIKIRLSTAESLSKDPNWNTKSIEESLAQNTIEHNPKPNEKMAAFGIFDEESHGSDKLDCQDCPTKTEPEAPCSSQSNTSKVFKVSLDKIDAILESLGELVVIKNQLLQCNIERKIEDARSSLLLRQLDKGVRELHESTLSMRLVPLSQTFRKLHRIILDTARKLNKKIEIVTEGEETEIDRIVVEEIADPLMHICRNAADHGIEDGETRRKRGKCEEGSITLKAYQDGNHIVIQVIDDGGGIDHQVVIKKALERSLLHPDQVQSIRDEQIHNLLLTAGFSTKDQVTDVSGRGVGMDVVKTNIQRLNGSISIDSAPTKGTCVTLRLPLSTTITEGIHVEVANEQYIIPIQNIRSFGELDEASVSCEGGFDYILFQGRYLPLIRLSQLFALNQESSEKVLILAESRNDFFVLAVDRVLGKIQTVLKPIEKSANQNVLCHGAAVMGDGHVAIVLDLSQLESFLERKAA